MKKILLFSFIAFVYCNTHAQSNSPILIRPPNTSTLVSLTDVLQWNNVSSAVSYEIWLSTDSNFSYLITPQIPDPSFAQLQLVAGWLQLNTTYYWKVRVVSPFTGDFSTTWRFTTIPYPQQGIGYLSNNVMSLFNNGVLPISQTNILSNALNQAINKLNQGDTGHAVSKLNNFIDRVSILENSNILNPNQSYFLQNGCTAIIDVISGTAQSRFILPSQNENNAHNFNLTQNYPNPFNPTTNIEFSIPERSYVSLKIYDILGNEIVTLLNRELNAGSYISIWNASKFSSGIYIYRLSAGRYSTSKKLVLNK